MASVARAAAATVPELQQAQRRGVERAALHATTIIRAEIRAVAGPDMRLSGVGKKGARVGARYDVRGTTNPTAVIRPVGSIPLIEFDTPARVIGPTARFVTRAGVQVRQGFRTVKGRRRAGGSTVLKIDGSFVGRPVVHPGTKGQEPFRKGWRHAAPETPSIFQVEVDKGLRRAWPPQL
jgi:hypothetical protein